MILITGCSSPAGIGFAAAHGLAEAGHRVHATVRDHSHVASLTQGLEDRLTVHEMDLLDHATVLRTVDAVIQTDGRLDVLVNNAGVGIGAPLAEIETKFLDMQLAVNLRSIILGTREGMPMLRKAGEEHRKALILNMASIAGKSGQPWLSIYGATKAAVLNFSVATEREVGKEGIACTAFAPAFVDTAMTDFVKGAVPAEEMIRPSDIGEGVRFLLNVSPNCHIPEVVFTRGGESDGAP